MSRRQAGLLLFPVAFLLDLAMLPVAVRADGSLPPLSYRYLHPPPAFQRGNKAPAAALQVLPVNYLNGTGWGAFTRDTQAGITGIRRSFILSEGTKAVVFRITPVNTPPGLPSEVAADGNTYRVTATEDPSRHVPGIRHPVHIVLRWPHIPLAIYTYRRGAWKQLCYSDQAVLTPSTISCPTATLGLFQAVTSPANVSSNTPSTPITQLNKYIPLIAAGALIIAAIILGFLVTRPDKRGGEDSPSARGRGSR
jgi:hypothetical protein